MNNRNLSSSMNPSITSSIGSLSIGDSPLRAQIGQSNFVDLTDGALHDHHHSVNDGQTLNNTSIVDFCVGARVMRGPHWKW